MDTISQLSSALAGRYTVEREIGHGGMATVYLARDARHNRNVALKVLNPELGAVLGVERFLAEIQVTANLQHPNLLPLFDSGEVNGLLFYVMPYVDGESLRARLSREKQLPVDEAVRISSAIAGALDYAHRHKVIHRDLKPENILMHEGQPLIADFGIALAVSNAGGARITQTGLSLGTPQYMSPEQATGDRVVDGRTDIYSLGAMTYEMLAGDPPHTASTSQAIIAKVLTERPTSIRTSRPNVPPHVDAAVHHALEKLAADRFATAREFADALEGRGVTYTTPAPGSASGPVARQRVRRREIVLASVAVVLASLLAWQILARPAPPVTPVVRANFDLPAGLRVSDAIAGNTIAVSPKGDMIAFTTLSGATFRVFLRRVNELLARQISEVAGRNLMFSPDGRALAFTEGNELKRVTIDGGELATVGTVGSAVPYGLAWSASGTIYVGSFSGLWTIPAGGGRTASLLSPRSDSGIQLGKRWPILLPGDEALVYAAGNSTTGAARLAVFNLANRTVSEFDIPAIAPLGLIDDQLVYVSTTGTLMSVRFDVGSLKPVGDPVQLDEGILFDLTAGAKAVLSRSGTLAYLSGRAQFQIVRVSPSAPSIPLLPDLGSFKNPRYSPDGRRVAVSATVANATNIWVYDVALNTLTRLTNEGSNIRPEWTPDGKRVLFISVRGGKGSIWWQPADGSGPSELLYEPEVEPFEAIVSPDAKWLIFRTSPGAKYPRDILAVPMTGERTVVPIVTGPGTESLPRLSPDGKWLAYQSSESGRFEIFVRPFPGSGARAQVSDNGGTEPIWSRSGNALYYRTTNGELIAVTVTTGAQFSVRGRRNVLTGDYLMDASHADYDVAPDGRFLLLKRAGAESQTIVVHNWGRELREKTSPRR
jgi:Tol biopolymer transport system component